MFNIEFNDMFIAEYESFFINDEPAYKVFEFYGFYPAVECLIASALSLILLLLLLN